MEVLTLCGRLLNLLFSVNTNKSALRWQQIPIKIDKFLKFLGQMCLRNIGLNRIYLLQDLFKFTFTGCAGSSLLLGLLLSYGNQGLLVAVLRLLTVWASLVAECRLQFMQTSVVVTPRLLKQGLSSWNAWT